MNATDSFEFVISNDNETTDGKVYDALLADADGKFAFEAIEFDEAGKDCYLVKELNENKNGVTYDSRVYRVVVEVVDEDGELKATVKTYNENDAHQSERTRRSSTYLL